MSCAALIAWLSLSTVPQVEVGDVLEPGLYPARVLLAACEAADGRRTVAAEPELLSYPVRVYVDLKVGKKTLPSLKIALRTAHLYRIDYTDRRNQPIAYVTLDPSVPPPEERGYEVAIVALEHLSAAAAIMALEKAAERLEHNLADDEFPTRFLAAPGGERLVIRYSSPVRLRHYRQVLADLDQPPEEEPKPVLRTWIPRSKPAQDLAQEFERRWRDREGAPAVHCVVARSHQALLFQVPEELWPSIRKLLLELDPSARDRLRAL